MPLTLPCRMISACTLARITLAPQGPDQRTGQHGGVGDALFGEEERAVGDRAEGKQAFGDLRAYQPRDPVSRHRQVGGPLLLPSPVASSK
ncbi:MAG: hypothetical protein ACK4GM_02820 [Tabrizicola sp.]